MKAIVSAYAVPDHESFAKFRSHHDHVTIQRVGRTDEDRWGVYKCGDRLRRNALKWRRRNPDAPLVVADDRLAAVTPERLEIIEAFEYVPQQSSRSDAWKRNHTFTLAEALFVCNVEAP